VGHHRERLEGEVNADEDVAIPFFYKNWGTTAEVAATVVGVMMGRKEKRVKDDGMEIGGENDN
jgi:hypothetical protein